MIDKQRKSDNRKLSDLKVTKGGIDFLNDRPLAGEDYIVTTIPEGVYVDKLVVLWKGGNNSALTATVKIRTNADDITTVGTIGIGDYPNSNSGGIIPAGIVTNDRTQILISVDEDLPSGKLTVGAMFVDLYLNNAGTVPELIIL